ncbi:MAG: hypothetical protein H7Y11_04945, partial [Armatimonadetes bacterium]|nr:hypothetical protein [Anaerolineae bacterium]
GGDLNDLDLSGYQREARPPRQSRVRERIKQRKQTPQAVKTGVLTPSTTTRRPGRQVETASITQRVWAAVRALPLNTLRLLAYGVGALLLVLGVIIGLNLFKDEAVVAQSNAIWLGTEWTYDTRTTEEVAGLAQRLRAHGVGTVYAWVSWYAWDATWAGSADGETPFIERDPAVKAFVAQMRAAYPEVRLYGWIGVPTASGAFPYRMNDAALREAVAQFSALVVNDLGFDGVFLNVEPVWDNQATDFLQLLSRVRLELGDSAAIAVAVPPDWTPIGVDIPQPELVTPGTVWDKKFKQRVALLTDEMAVMAYNSGLTTPFDYIPWMAYQVQVYAEAVAELSGGAQIIIGIPTYANELPGHNTQVENVSSAMTGVQQGILQAGDAARVIAGTALYAEWETDATEWTQYLQGGATR